MALRHRHIPVDFLPREGIVDVSLSGVDNEVLSEAVKLNEQYENLSVFKDDLAEFMKNDKFEGFQISTSEILYQLQQTLCAFVRRNQVSGDDKFAEHKNLENSLALEAIKNINTVYEDVFKTEFSDKKLVRLCPEKENIFALRKKEFKKITAEKCAELDIARKVIEPAYKMCMYINQNFPNYKNNRLVKVSDLCKKLFMKVSGNDVMYKPATPEDVFSKLAPRIESLIASDYDVNGRYSRSDAMMSLARELDKIGLELDAVYINKMTPQEEELSMAKTCILRADWSGYIERPDISQCSSALKDIIYKGNEPVAPERYDLRKSDIFNLCEQMDSFKEFRSNGHVYSLKEIVSTGLGKIGFPPERVSEIGYTDIAYIINAKLGLSAESVKKMAAQGTKSIDAVRIPSARKQYFKNMATEHKDELEVILKSQHISEKRINKIISSMLEGNVPDERFNGHHNTNINQHTEFEKETGLPWYEMNKKAVVLMDPTTHYFVHMIENFVSSQGKVSDAGLKAGGRDFQAENSTVATRTIFIDNNTGQQYFFTIRVKQYSNQLQQENSDKKLNVVALFENLVTIFDKNFLAKIKPEKQNQDEFSQTKDFKTERKRIENRAEDVENRKSDKKKHRKEETSRPNYRGLGAHGSHNSRFYDNKKVLGA